MGKKTRGQSSGISVPNGNSGCMNKILNALDRRHRWPNVPKGLPSKRQASGKHVIADGSNSENTSQPPDPKKNNKPPKNEQETAETHSKKFRIRSLISDEMAKRRGKHQRRRSSSPTQSPKKKSNSFKKTDSDHENETPRARARCDSPSTTKKKRKCDICAAMLTVSYLRQKANMATQDQKQQPADHSRTGLTKSVSFPLLASKKTRDSDLQELKCKLRGLKDIQTTKDRFILPMNHWKDTVGLPKPMLTRPASFKAIGSTSRKDQKKQTTNQSKTLKQKIGLVIKVDGRKEKRRILMDAVFHKVPYGGRKSSKDPRKLNPDKLKTTPASDQSLGKKTHLKKTSSTNEAMSKYRKLLSQTSTRDEKLMQQHSTDHKPKLFVAGDHSSGKKTHKRIRSLPNISPDDFIHNQEFPVKPTTDIHLNISTAVFDNQRSSDHFARRNVSESTGKETKINDKDDQVVYENLQGVDTNTSDHQEEINHQNESEAAIKSGAKQETSLIEKDEAIQENLRVGGHDYQEQNHLDEDLEVGPTSSNQQDNTDEQNEPRVAIQLENDKSFNEILGMFKKVSDERTKLNNENEPSGTVRKVAKNNAVDKVQDVHKNLEVSQNTMDHQEKDTPGSEHTSDEGVPQKPEVSQKTLEHNEEDMSSLSSSYEVDNDHGVDQNLEEKGNSPKTSCSEIEWSMQDSALDSSSLIDIPNSSLEDYPDEKKQYTSSMNDVDEKRANNEQGMNAGAYDKRIKNGFLHLDLESVKDNAEFQFVKQVLEKSGFMKNELLGEWYSSYQPIDPLLFEEVETSFLQSKILEELDSMKDEEVVQKIINDHHLLLFDLINEALLEIHNKSYTYCPHPLTYRSKVSPMPEGCRVLEEVWDIVNTYLSWKPESQPSLDDAVSRDLAKGNGWMNLQADAEFVGIELEEFLVDDLVDELVFDDLLM
ncbi:hypothetical protein L1987_05272 [Smallanthus sonchifolius]|uniref:Uncharacterized protein n=1 Tax=Smallanthus sonchifolius TaxID=185202 RepID=A0ACB9JUV8_9ASTR|nr:hypothetical protein L1987_05272 [Smallanthus sonchifolius]